MFNFGRPKSAFIRRLLASIVFCHAVYKYNRFEPHAVYSAHVYCDPRRFFFSFSLLMFAAFFIEPAPIFMRRAYLVQFFFVLVYFVFFSVFFEVV